MVSFDVLMPVYAGDDASLFEIAVKSVFINTLQPDNFIIVVDGPVNEGVEMVLRSTAKAQKYVKVVRLPANVGLARALNEGLQYCESEFVFRCDADDINMPERFARQLSEALNRSCDIFGAQIIEVDPVTAEERRKLVPVTHGEISKYARLRNPINHMTVMFRRSVVLGIGGYPNVMYKEDYALWLRALSHGYRLGNSSALLVRATAGDSMISRRQNFASVKSEWDLMIFRAVGLGSGYSSVFPTFLLRITVLLLPKRLLRKIYSQLRN